MVSIRRYSYIIFIFLILYLSSSNLFSQTVEDVSKTVDELKQKLCPDSRLGILEINVAKENGKIVLEGELSEKLFYEKITKALFDIRNKVEIEDRITVLPLKDLKYKYALAISGVSDIRREPNKKSELITQAIMGQEMKLFKKEGNWYLVKLDKDYIGWVKAEDIYLCDKDYIYDWNEEVNVMIWSNFADFYDKPFIKQIQLGTMVAGTKVRLVRSGAIWSKVMVPNKSEVWVETVCLEEFDPEMINEIPDGESLIATGIRFLGIDYLWGGKSPFGFDCSGFVKTVFMLNGIDLPRDANQQALCGIEVEIDENFSKLKTGDLLFFGKNRVTHVAIYIKDGWYIHSSGYVRINNLLKDRDAYVGYRKSTLLNVKRVLE